MKEERKKELREMIKDVDDRISKYPVTKKECYRESTVGPDIEMKKILTSDEILSKISVQIPKCDLEPVNGRIYLVEVTGTEVKTASGLILPHKMKVRKDDSAKDINRYFVVAWDNKDIPESITSRLEVGKEINPFLPDEAEEWDLPRVIDWSTGNVFKVVHFTELAGISKLKPEEAQ